jgi:hypothetical protein
MRTCGSSTVRAMQRAKATPKSSYGSMRELNKSDQCAVIEFFAAGKPENVAPIATVVHT